MLKTKKFAIILWIFSLMNFSTQAATYEYAVIGDAGLWNASSRKVRDSIVTNNVSSLILPGDNLYDPSTTYESTWAPWSDKGLTFDIVAIGNHHLGYKKEMAFFKMPAEYFSQVIHQDLKFIVLNSDNETHVREQMQWLDKEIRSSSQPLIFITYHHPTYTISSKHRWTEKKEFQLGLRTIFKKYRSKITALLIGHDHMAEMATFGDLPVILSGATHEFRTDQPVDYTENGVSIKTQWFFDNHPYWVKLKIDTERKTTLVDFIRAEDNLISCTFEILSNQALTAHDNCKANPDDLLSNKGPALQHVNPHLLR